MSTNRCAFHYEYPEPHKDLDPGCQFADETEFFPCGDERFCRFHLPIADQGGSETSKAKWSEEDLEAFQDAIDLIISRNAEANETTNFSGVVFPTEIVFEEKEFDGLLCYRSLFAGPANFKNAKVQGAVFQDAQFKGYAYFHSAQFEGNAYFHSAQFEGDAYFPSAQFKGYAYFRNARIKGHADFHSAQFEGNADFHSAQFEGNAGFQYAHFEDHADFRSAQIKGYADFRSAQIKDHADFRSARIKGYADFRSTQIKGNANFHSAQFEGNTGFQGARIKGDAYFHSAQFEGNAGFQGAQIKGSADFRSAQIKGHAGFRRTQFKGHADFRSAQFQGNAVFRSAQFEGHAVFSWSPARTPAKPKGDESQEFEDAVAYDGSFQNLDFSGANVHGVADFSDRTFTKAVGFSGLIFGRAPLFHGSKLHQGTKWDGTEFLDRSSKNAEQAYRTLRLAMEQIRDRPQEGVFFALEQESMRNNLPGRNLRWWLSRSYGAVSNYGQSLSRPLGALLLVSFCFFHWYGILYCFTAGQLPPNGFGQGMPFLRLTLLQIVKPLAIWGKPDPQVVDLFGNSLQLALLLSATVQSLLSATLIGLFILALRWQFRRA